MLLEFDGTFIFALISFMIFVLMMNIILYKPITKIMDERQKFYDKNKNTADLSKQRTDEVLKNKEAEILSAKLEASNILQTVQNNAKVRREELLRIKKEEHKNKLINLEKQLVSDNNNAKTILKDQVSEYVKIAVSKVLDEDMNNIGSINIDDSRIDSILEAQK